MKYGMNLLLWTDHLDESILPVLESLKEMGNDGVEVPVFQLDESHYQAWGQRLDELGLERTAVTVRGGEENYISGNAAVRAAGVAANKRTLDCCQALGAQVLCGPYHSALGEFSGDWTNRRRVGLGSRQYACGSWACSQSQCFIGR